MTRVPRWHRIALPLALLAAVPPLASAQAPAANRANSIALEADILAYFISGYSGIVNVSLRNGFQAALGFGRYDVPKFLLDGDENYETAKWKATVTSVVVFRTGYRFKGPMRSGPALAAVVLNQNWHMKSAPLNGETKFRELSLGLSGGYYLHITKHFYAYPTAAFTFNSVKSGSTSINGTSYTVPKSGPNASLHVGWAW